VRLVKYVVNFGRLNHAGEQRGPGAGPPDCRDHHRELKLEEITPETFDPDMDLVDELGVDSMDLATVALVLQDEYGVFIDEDDYPT